MRLYEQTVPAVFVRRLNRFTAVCLLNGAETLCHVANTGRLRELLVPGARVWLVPKDGAGRKTAFTLVAAEKDGRTVNIDSLAPNRVFAEYARSGAYLPGLTALRSEVPFGSSRIDFAWRDADGRPGLTELKGVTLFDENGVAYFPDAPTERGVRHLRELADAAGQGIRAGVCFMLMRPDAVALRPNDRTQPAFGEALREAEKAGVSLRAVCCRVTPEEVVPVGEVPVLTRKGAAE